MIHYTESWDDKRNPLCQATGGYYGLTDSPSYVTCPECINLYRAQRRLCSSAAKKDRSGVGAMTQSDGQRPGNDCPRTTTVSSVIQDLIPAGLVLTFIVMCIYQHYHHPH